MSNIRFKPAGTQPVPDILPGQGDPSTVDPLGGPKAPARIDYLAEALHGIVKGKHLTIGNQNKGGKFLRQQANVMWKEGMIPEDVGAYMRDPIVDRLIKYNPTSHRLIEHKTDILGALSAQGINDVRIAGTDFLHGEQYSLPRIVQSHRMTIAPAGDWNTVKEVADLVAAKMEEHKENASRPVDAQQHYYRDHPLVIENIQISSTAHFWDPYLRGVKILNHDTEKSDDILLQREFVDFEALAKLYGIYITESREETLKHSQSIAKKLPEPET